MAEPMPGFIAALDALQGVERDLLPGAPPGDAPALAGKVHERLAALLQAQLQQARQAPTPVERDVLEAGVYTSAAVLDEALAITLDWPGRRLWTRHLLEQRLFESRLAGRRFFEDVERTLKSDAGHAGWRHLAAVQLLALQAGFKGRYRDAAAGAQLIGALRQRLYAFSEGDGGPGATLSPQAHRHHRVIAPSVRLDPRRPWRAALGVLLLWIIGSGLWWQWIVQDLRSP